VERIGVLGGTFDPPHIGHLVLAEYAAAALGLEHVLFVPAGEPPHKLHLKRTSAEHRIEMVERAISSNKRFSLSRIDVDRPGPHYTVDLMTIVHENYPKSELYFLMGGDSFRDLPKWHRPQDILKYCNLGVMARPDSHQGNAKVEPEMHEAVLPGLSRCVTMIEAPLLDVASSDIVVRIQQGKSVRYLVPDEVWDYIKAHAIYEVNGR
jgi:nicotinate-nucleotide adenylyltransferase